MLLACFRRSNSRMSQRESGVESAKSISRPKTMEFARMARAIASDATLRASKLSLGRGRRRASQQSCLRERAYSSETNLKILKISTHFNTFHHISIDFPPPSKVALLCITPSCGTKLLLVSAISPAFLRMAWKSLSSILLLFSLLLSPKHPGSSCSPRCRDPVPAQSQSSTSP